MAQGMVEFRGVSFDIGGARILHDLNLEVHRGEILVLLGESGCGKTTTLKLVNRLLEPTGGVILVDGRPLTEWSEIAIRRHVGFVLQEGGLFPHLTIQDNVGLPLVIRDSEQRNIKSRVREVLEIVGLDFEKFAPRYPHELSGGQRQRVGVARALVPNPDLLLLDEPFGALDAITRANLQNAFASIVRELRKTAVFVTHDLNEAMLLASRIALMEKGRIVLADEPSRFVASDLPLARAYLETVSSTLRKR